MTLTFADIERWDAGDVREVFHAASSRAQAVQDAADGLAELPAFTTWGGEAAEAAKEAIGKTRADLDAHGQEALAVANAARSAADEIDRIKSELAILKADAAALGMEIDPVTGQVVAGPGVSGHPMEVLLKQQQLQPRVDKLIAEANQVDMALANAIDMAGGDTPIPASPHTNDPEIQAALNQPMPEDPREFNELWDKLNKEQRDWLFEQDPGIGNHPGMPWGGGAENPGKDFYNRQHLESLTADAQADIDRLTAAHPEWARDPALLSMPGYPPPGWETWRQQWDKAHHALNGYKSVNSALQSPDGVPRLLGVIDDQGHAAVSIGNPDTASRTATLVPGTGQDLTAFEGASFKSAAMYDAAIRADRSLSGELAVMTWMGYDRPMTLMEAGSADYARNGAGALDAYMAGLEVTHVGPQAVDTVIGHSYGSTLVGAAGADGHHLAAENVIAVGSPGILVNHASELSLDAGGNVYAMRADNDIIELVSGAVLGLNPTWDGFGAVELAAAPGPTWGPEFLGLPSVAAHSSYWDPGNPALLNMGAVIAGQTPPQIVPNG